MKELTTNEERAQFIDKFDNYLFDCDGTLQCTQFLQETRETRADMSIISATKVCCGKAPSRSLESLKLCETCEAKVSTFLVFGILLSLEKASLLNDTCR